MAFAWHNPRGHFFNGVTRTASETDTRLFTLADGFEMSIITCIMQKVTYTTIIYTTFAIHCLKSGSARITVRRRTIRSRSLFSNWRSQCSAWITCMPGRPAQYSRLRAVGFKVMVCSPSLRGRRRVNMHGGLDWNGVGEPEVIGSRQTVYKPYALGPAERVRQ